LKKIQTTITIFLLLILIPATFMGGRLSTFKDDLRNSNDTQPTSNKEDDKLKDSGLDEDNSFNFILAIIEMFVNNAKQTYARYPYQHKDIAFNHRARRAMGDRKKWTLATTIEYQRFDDQLNAIVLDLDLTFAGFLKLKISSNSLQEKMVNYKDSMTLLNFMAGIDIVTADNFIFGARMGIQKVTDYAFESNMAAYNLYMHIFPVKPLVFDLQWTGAFYNDVTTEEFKVRVGFMVGMYDLGIGYSWLRLNNADPMNAINFSVRFWM